MFDVFRPPQFARPTSVRKLPSGVGVEEVASEERDFFETRLQTVVLTFFVAQAFERVLSRRVASVKRSYTPYQEKTEARSESGSDHG